MRRWVAAGAVVLALAACSSGSGAKDSAGSSTASKAASPGLSSGAYKWKAPDGGTVIFDIPAPGTGNLLGQVEDYRTAVGAGEVQYVLAHLDNTDGHQQLDLPTLSVVTPSGHTLTFTVAWETEGGWQDLVDANDPLYNEGVDLYNEMLNSETALPGAKNDALMIAEGGPFTISRVFVQGFGEPKPTELTRV